MKILVATARTRGEQSSDYHWCVEGELVWIQEPCRTDRLRWEPSCGCGRGFAGLVSHRATTTAEIVDLDVTLDDYREALRVGIVAGGWPGEVADDIAEPLVEFAASWETGTVIERDLDVFTARRGASLPSIE